VEGVCSETVVEGVCSETVVEGVCSETVVEGVCRSRTLETEMEDVLLSRALGVRIALTVFWKFHMRYSIKENLLISL
jgi:hypothetical protein